MVLCQVIINEQFLAGGPIPYLIYLTLYELPVGPTVSCPFTRQWMAPCGWTGPDPFIYIDFETEVQDCFSGTITPAFETRQRVQKCSEIIYNKIFLLLSK